MARYVRTIKMKLIVNVCNKYLSEAFQKYLFEQGYEWYVAGKSLQKDTTYIVVHLKSQKMGAMLEYETKKVDKQDMVGGRIFNLASDFDKVMELVSEFVQPIPKLRVYLCKKGNCGLTATLNEYAVDIIGYADVEFKKVGIGQ